MTGTVHRTQHHGGLETETLPLLSYKWPPQKLHMFCFHEQPARLPESGLEDLSRSALFGVVVVAVEKVSKHSLVGGDVHSLQAVHALCAGLRQRQT